MCRLAIAGVVEQLGARRATTVSFEFMSKILGRPRLLGFSLTSASEKVPVASNMLLVHDVSFFFTLVGV